MNGFKFRLERVLSYKSRIEDQKKQILADRNHHLNKETAALDNLYAKKKNYEEKYGALFKGLLNVYGLVFSRRYLDRLDNNIVSQTKKVNVCREKVNIAKAALREAMRDRKKYEMLKDKKRREYEYLAGKEEQKEFDELACGRKAGPLSAGKIR